MKQIIKTISILITCLINHVASAQRTSDLTYKDYIRKNVAVRQEIDVFLNELSWAKFDSVTGYKLGNYMPHDGIDNGFTISTSQPNGARTSFIYSNKKCRINAYGNSFTQCHQVSDGETWEEYLAADLGEPIRNFGMGGFGAYQSYRRMLQIEQTADSAEYLIYYIWGDDHIRSLLRCRYMLIKEWINTQAKQEGIGKMFHGNFWPNIEMNFSTGKLEEKNNLISSEHELYKMTDPVWMNKALDDDLALQMSLYKNGAINNIDVEKVKKLAAYLKYKGDLDNPDLLKEAVTELLDKYAFAATEYILNKIKVFASHHNKKLMVILFDPYRVTNELLQNKSRYDKEVVDFLSENKFNFFDMNLVHVADFKNFNLSIGDYYKRYFIGHYTPSGNHFFAFSIKPQIVKWLNPKPITYQHISGQMINFKGYLENY